MPELASTLITELRYELKDTGSDQNYTDAELLVYLNDAVEHVVKDITGIWPHYWLRTNQVQSATSNIVSGTASYSLPTDCYYTVMVTTKDSTGVTEIRDSLDFERTFDADADGWFARNDKIYLYSTPTASVASGLTVYYVSRPSRIAATSQNVPLSDDFRGLIKEYAAIKAKARQEENSGEFRAAVGQLSQQLHAMMVRTNMGKDTGWKIPRRWWI